MGDSVQLTGSEDAIYCVQLVIQTIVVGSAKLIVKVGSTVEFIPDIEALIEGY